MVILSSLPPPSEGIRVTQPQTKAVVGNQDMHDGTLYITESVISWVSSVTGEGFSLHYPGVTLHAISRDTSVYPEECIYVMIDADAQDPKPRSKIRHQPEFVVRDVMSDIGRITVSHQTPDVGQMSTESNGHSEENEDDEEETDSGMSEIRFIPADKTCLEVIFGAIADCQALHPDEDDSEDDGLDDNDYYGNIGEGDEFYNAQNVDDAELTSEGQAILNRIMGGADSTHDEHMETEQNGHQ